MKTWLLGAGFVFAWALISGGMDRRDAEITAAIERETRERVATFATPIEWTAKVTQCSTKEGCRTRYYYPSQK